MKDKLLSEGWSVPVVGSITELNVSEPGISLVSTSETRKAIKELKGLHPLAILYQANIDNRGEELHVLTADVSA